MSTALGITGVEKTWRCVNLLCANIESVRKVKLKVIRATV